MLIVMFVSLYLTAFTHWPHSYYDLNTVNNRKTFVFAQMKVALK